MTWARYGAPWIVARSAPSGTWSQRLVCHGMAILGSRLGDPGRDTHGQDQDERNAERFDRTGNGTSPAPAERSGSAARAISPRKLWELTNMREVPPIRIGRCLRYPREGLVDWVANRRGR